MYHLIFLAGFIQRFWVILKSRFTLLNIDPGDPRLINFILEWTYQCLRHLDFTKVWSPPYYYPLQNTLTRGDNLFGGFLTYAPFRFLGLNPSLSYQLWIMSFFFLNYYTSYFILRKMERSRFESHLGSFLFAFSIPLMQNIGHAMHYALFPSLLYFYFIFQFLREPSKRLPLVLASLSLSYQFYSVIYEGMFALIVTLPFVAASLYTLRPPWKKIVTLPNLISVFIFFVVPVALLMIPYYQASREFGPREWEEVRYQLATLQGYLTPANDSLYLPLTPAAWLKEVYENERRLFLGIIPTLLFIGSLFLIGRKKNREGLSPFAKVCFVTALFNIVINFNVNGYSFWKLIYLFLPGYSALRGIGRLNMMNIFFLSFFLVSFWSQFASLRKKYILLLLFVLFMVDQWGIHIGVNSSEAMEERTARIAKHIDKDEIFLVQSKRAPEKEDDINIDAMWAAMEQKAFTINGCNGQESNFYHRLFKLGQITCRRLDQYLLPTLKEKKRSLSILFFIPFEPENPLRECTQVLYSENGTTKLRYPLHQEDLE